VTEIPGWLPAYAREIADGLGLKDWEFECRLGCDDAENEAECHLPSEDRFARLHFDPEFFARGPERQRRIVVHELLHAHVNQIWWPLLRDLRQSGCLSTPVYNMAQAAMQREIERATSGIGNAIDRHFPLPPEETHETQDEHGAGADAGV
jgi:hypothetical protein